MSTGPKHPTSFCPRVKSLIAFSHLHHSHRVYPVRCKCWTCPFCYRKNLGQLIKQIEANPPDRFLTLTARPGYMETPMQVYLRHRPFIRKLFEKARRKFGKQEYAVFCELHKSGYPHWHILQRGEFIPFKWLSATWEALTGSKIVDIRRCSNARDAARYVVKYVTKSNAHARIDPRFRIVTFSKHFRGARQRNRLHPAWTVEYDRRHPDEVIAGYKSNWKVTWEGEYFLCVPHSHAYGIDDSGDLTHSGVKLCCTLDAQLNSS